MQFNCPNCHQTLSVPDDAVGQKARCPSCKTRATVPGADAGYDPTEQQALDELFSGVSSGSGNRPSGAAQRSAAGPAPARQAGKASRYRGRAAKRQSAECVVGVFDCEADEGFGHELAGAVRDELLKDRTFQRIIVSEDPDETGEALTVEDGICSLSVIPGGMFKQGSCNVAASAVLINAEGETATTSATAQLAGNPKQVLKASRKQVAQTIAREALHHATGFRRLRQEISALATASLVFGIIGLIPFLCFVFFILSLIPALVALFHNRGRPEKIGLIRMGVGLGLAFIGCIISFAIISKSP